MQDFISKNCNIHVLYMKACVSKHNMVVNGAI